MTQDRFLTHFRLAAFLFLPIVALLVWSLSGESGGKKVKDAKQQAQKPTKLYYGLSACKRCHNEAKPFVDEKLPPVCRCTEMPIWTAKDKHAIAWQALTTDRAKRMGQLLKIADVKQDKQCVSCHGVWVPKEEKQFIDNKTFTLAEGVSCVACHGPYAEWIFMHGVDIGGFREKWRKLSRETKETQYGMTDLWNPAKRARLCASCHIGNVEEGKVVTHDMYAAGHPPLPGFEPATFSNQMPRHWQYLKEKDDAILKILDVQRPQAQLEETNLLAIGGLVALEQTLNMVAAQTEHNWPELAQFDCYACHHELKSKSWRQKRGYAGRPGRPPMRQWPAALVELSLHHAALDSAEANQLCKEFAARLAKVQAAFDRQPFGDKAAIKASADETAKWLRQQIQRIQANIEKKKYTKKSPQELLRYLQQVPEKNTPDYDSARQLAWALKVLESEAMPHDDFQKLVDSARWQKLNDYMRLTFPAGQVYIEETLPDALQHISNYEPDRFFLLFNDVFKKQPRAR